MAGPQWLQLLQAARRISRPAHNIPTLQYPVTKHPNISEWKRREACAKVQEGALSRAHQVLTPCDVARRNEARWAALTDPAEARAAIVSDMLQQPVSRACEWNS